MTKLVLLVLVVLASAGCATEGKFREKLQRVVGMNVSDLMQRIGPPETTFDMPNGNKIYTWTHSAGARSTAAYNPYTHQAMAQTNAMYCRTSFVADPSGTIQSVSYEGNTCISE